MESIPIMKKNLEEKATEFKERVNAKGGEVPGMFNKSVGGQNKNAIEHEIYELISITAVFFATDGTSLEDRGQVSDQAHRVVEQIWAKFMSVYALIEEEIVDLSNKVDSIEDASAVTSEEEANLDFDLFITKVKAERLGLERLLSQLRIAEGAS